MAVWRGKERQVLAKALGLGLERTEPSLTRSLYKIEDMEKGNIYGPMER